MKTYTTEIEHNKNFFEFSITVFRGKKSKPALKSVNGSFSGETVYESFHDSLIPWNLANDWAKTVSTKMR